LAVTIRGRQAKPGEGETPMRRLLMALTLALIALPAWAQTQTDWCASPTATDDQTIQGCTVLIKSGNDTGAKLSAEYDNRAFAENNKGLNDQAIADENQALALNPDNSNAYMNRGLSYYAKSLYDQAIADYTRSISLKSNTEAAYNNSGNAFAYNDRGLAYGRKGQLDKAIADYTQAMALAPRFVLPYNNRAMVYEKSGARAKAIADYRAALSIDPANKDAKAGLGRLGVAP
jgi:tetratricopeptide (TPR) repeat protein